ncbi:MAG: hypothetical protein N2C14_07685, partial [Planctomycetales bacterium]
MKVLLARVFASLVVIVGAMAAHAQTPAAPAAPVDPNQPKTEESADKPTDEAKETEATDEAKKAEATAKAKEQARILKIKQLKFDRRASAILKAWSTPPGGNKDSKDPKPPTSETKPKDEFDLALGEFVRNVTLGHWNEVKSFLATLSKDEGKTLYQHLVAALASKSSAISIPAGVKLDPAQLARMQSARTQQQGRISEQQNFNFDDVMAIADAAPAALEDEHFASLGKIAKLAIHNGHVIDQLIARLKAEAAKPDDQSVLDARESAKLLLAADQPSLVGEFLPTLEQAKEENDHEALNFLSQHYMALYADENKIEFLEKAWQVTQAVLSADEIDQEQKGHALKQAVGLAPRIRDELGQDWLEDSFTKRPQRGMEIIATIGSAA